MEVVDRKSPGRTENLQKNPRTELQNPEAIQD
jgi:hypothetical protein